MAEVIVINPTVAIDTKKLKVCAYARVSSDSSDQLNSFISQVNHYTNFIQSNDAWEFVDVYADEGLTGTCIDKREEFQRMIKDCRKGNIDKILTKSISRFSRNTRDCIETIRELKMLGISIEFEKEEIDTETMASEMIVGILGSLAQEESISISNNMRWSYQKRMQSGDFITCCPPYGYKLENNTIVINPDEAEIVKRIFNSYVIGKGKSEIAQELAEENIPKKDGNTKWQYKTIQYIISNEKYIGDSLVQKRCTTDTLPFRKIRNNGQKDKYYVRNTHEPIIDRETFNQAQKLNEFRNAIKTSEPKQYSLTKMIQCGECGCTLKRRARKNDSVYWMCYNHFERKDKCSIRQIDENEIYSAFIRLYNKLKHNSQYILNPLLDQLETMKNKSTMRNVKIGEINKQIAELTEQNLILTRLRSKGYMDSAIFMEQANEINNNINALRKVRRTLLDNDENDNEIVTTKKLISIIDDSADILTEFNELIFKSIVQNIIIKEQDHLTFRLINGLELTETIRRKVR